MEKGFLNRIYEKNPDIVFRVIGGEAILVPLSKETQAVGRLFTLNEAGAFIWEKIDGKHTVGDLASEVQKEYEVSPETAGEDLRELVKSLEEVYAIKQKKST